jgi:hypothetical protein
MAGGPTRKQMVERRVWRLGYLLTGDAAGAAALVDRVVRTRPDVVEMEPAKLDRLVIQHAREVPGKREAPREGGAAAAEALGPVLGLTGQAREAWVLTHIDLLDDLHVSRAMDCSKTAVRNHLAAAEERMKAVLMERLGPATTQLRQFADGLDPGAIIAAHRAQRRAEAQKTALVLACVAGVLLLGVAYVVLRVLNSS